MPPSRRATIALFRSVLGVPPGITDAADRLRAAGHEVRVVDQYDGRVFGDDAEDGDLAAAIGYPQSGGADPRHRA